MLCHNESDDGNTFDLEQKLQFRSLNTVTEDLNQAGLDVVRISRNWPEDAFTNTSEEPRMAFEARQPATR